MKRDIVIKLCEWKNDPLRKPLIIRGARQVGKTWVANAFGKEHYKNFVSINLELQPQFRSCFENLDPAEIINRIELTANVQLTSPDTLLFLDEIQTCPKAISALRYFYELKPELSIIAAGSLLEFIEKNEDLSFPVGRVTNFFLSPLSFGEFLTAFKEERLREHLATLTLSSVIAPSVEIKASDLLKKYLYVGGMPATVAQFVTNGKLSLTDQYHSSLLQNYRHDFGKYGKINSEILEKTYMKIPGMVGTSFRYNSIDNAESGKNIKRAVDLLEKARIHSRIFSTSAAGLPFYTYKNERKFKTLFLDVGLLQNAMGISSQTYLAPDLLSVYRGAVTEQYVGQQLLALKKPYEEPDLFFWQRDAVGSESEVDYLFQYQDKIIPIEVKSGKTGTLKSMKLFLEEKKAPFGIRFSQLPLSFHEKILSIPLYAIESTPNLVEELIGNPLRESN